MINYETQIGGLSRALGTPMAASAVPMRARMSYAPGVFGGGIVGTKSAALGRTGGQLT